LSHRLPLGDDRNDAQPTVALGALQDVDRKGPA
jgi:hypothetical protein